MVELTVQNFPAGPTDGMIFEPTFGIFYQYNAATSSWVRISMPSLPLATPTSSGLMSSSDFTKLTGLIIPPPQITLAFEDCADVEFNTGVLSLKGDDFGIINVMVEGGKLHENTSFINFEVDTEKLAQRMMALGQLRLTAPQGDRGPMGPSGIDGENALPVGPQGEDGQDGANAPWPGTLTAESFDVAEQNRAIVDIDVELVSPDENYLIVKRANIGNPNACPDTIIPQDIQSPWVLAFDTAISNTATAVSSRGLACGWACRSALYYFDMDGIVQSIRSHWVGYLNGVKTSMETLASTWLGAMMSLFNQQKSALCCALEACRSRSRNQSTRQYIESQRIAAAMGNLQIQIGGDADKEFPPLNADGNAAWNIAPTNFNLIHLSDPSGEIDWPSFG